MLEKTVFPKNYPRQQVVKFRNIFYVNGVRTWLSAMWGVLNKAHLALYTEDRNRNPVVTFWML